MSAEAWHADSEALRDWVHGTAGPLASVSVEQHLAHCEHCRGEVAALAPQPALLHAAWTDVLTEIERPRAPAGERLLNRLGLSSSDSRVIAAAASLRWAWLGAITAVLFFIVLAADLGHDGGIGLFLIVAPLIPVAGVAAAYGPTVDPSYEAVVAAPYSMLRLVLLRTAAVIITSIPFTVAAGLLLPTSPIVAVAWLLPSFGFVVAVLAASNWIGPDRAAVAVGIGWACVVGWAIKGGNPLEVFRPAAVLVYVTVIAGGGLVFAQRVRSAKPSWRMR